MATFTLTYDTGTVPLTKIIDAIALEYNYQATIPDPNDATKTITNTETKAQFSKRMIGTVIKNIVKNQDIVAVRATADATVTPITLS